MFRVGQFSLLLILGLVFSQLAPRAMGPSFAVLVLPLRLLTMTALAFIMIHVGYDFEIDKRHVRAYAYDYWVATTAAALPWVFCTLYLAWMLGTRAQLQSGAFWERMALLSRFSAPTSAGVLFSMLAAAGLGTTWVFMKARVLAIFDDVDTILAVTLLQMVMVGIVWQLAAVIGINALLLWGAWRYMRALYLPRTWPWVLLYATMLALTCEALAHFNAAINPDVPARVEVLLPAFVLGCVTARSASMMDQGKKPDTSAEAWIVSAIAACFMFLVGASIPLIGSGEGPLGAARGIFATLFETRGSEHFGAITRDVLILTLLINLGKMFPALCYRRQASLRERLALGVSMFPRGEVGAGVLVISVAYGITGAALTVATLSLVLNLACTGLFIAIVRFLLAGVSRSDAADESEA